MSHQPSPPPPEPVELGEPATTLDDLVLQIGEQQVEIRRLTAYIGLLKTINASLRAQLVGKAEAAAIAGEITAAKALAHQTASKAAAPVRRKRAR